MQKRGRREDKKKTLEENKHKKPQEKTITRNPTKKREEIYKKRGDAAKS
jgi:hypothetical protein